MSQKKVDKYKEEKANRQKIIKKEKRARVLSTSLLTLALVALVAWFVVSLVQNRMANTVPAATTIDVTSLDDFQDQLSTYGEESGEEEETSGETEETSGETEETSETE